MENLLAPIAHFFQSLGLPEPIVHWGHPTMMAIVVLVMGSYAGVKGWQGRLATDAEAGSKNRAAHAQVVPWMFLFIVLGYTGGVLSLVMQDHPIFESPHFWTGTIVIALLATNAVLSLANFWGAGSLRTAHAYLGSSALVLLLVHAFLGLQLGLSL
ncbi:MAG: DUF4079 domain-containing protein [Acaryochloris sp. RU_4_1]|nr:DUF4079 domain-containing protein [Acaryochloris sp. SU_5_25]NJM66512.1 DUF4079 domain-containing protein [Acaryochloris sp. RU_4_1]NJR54341.1 DUF4079 domain-containing protein [Acaryochloris sp. CRU_2_0]